MAIENAVGQASRTALDGAVAYTFTGFALVRAQGQLKVLPTTASGCAHSLVNDHHKSGALTLSHSKDGQGAWTN